MKTEQTYRSNIQQEEERIQIKRQEFEKNRRQWEESLTKPSFQDQIHSSSLVFISLLKQILRGSYLF